MLFEPVPSRPAAAGSVRPLIIDSFAGGGGASTGMEMALGRSPDIAINHNPAALALHAANHPETLHLSENIYRVDPLDHVAGRHVGLAHFSPDCKHFSKAKGGKPVERNIRDLAWVIVLWAERAKPDVITMENVEEWKDWGPLVETGRGLMPDPARRGETFRAWLKAMRRLGYRRIEWRELRACDYGAPTIRKRLFLVARCDGKPIVWPDPTHGSPDDPDVVAGRKLPWRTAAECIDWSLPCPSIFDTSDAIMEKHGLRAIRPLAAATMARVARGMKRYVLDAERPFIVRTDMASAASRNGVNDIEMPLNTVMTAGSFGIVSPSVIRFNTGATGQDARKPLSTITANSYIEKPGGAAPLGVIAPHLMTMRNAGKPFNGADEPAHTITAGGAGLTLVASTLVQTGYGEREGQSPRALDPDKPLGTIMAGGVKHAAACAYLAQHNNDSRRTGGVNPGRPASEPLSTVTQSGSQQGIVSAFVSRQFGTSTGHAMDAPSATAMGDGGGKSALIAPYLQAYYGVDQDTPETEPVHTLTTKPRFGHVESKLSPPPFTADQASRAREVAAFLRAHGFWDDREFVTIAIGGETFVVVDIGMRMLTPRELYNAQGFPPDYVIDGGWQTDEDTGEPVWVSFPKSVQVSCVGNSVSPPVMAALVAANCPDLAVWREAAE
ncbi:DNA cytosine methyltransferase [Shinella pollutisoli]|uniref:DNA (cytosine-5-)-methyltransferase n=1 Tax=Shinella pollutisoli TaxID=2250594 RepID=A0ABV7D9D9_9HYPH|nr:DNA cytosine methyltransferase [Shinella pollutisoli]